MQAEILVEEWFNQNGYFTIRGIKDGIEEIDILAIKNLKNGRWDCVHCEVQVSVRPVAYIAKMIEQVLVESGAKSKTSAKLRTESQIEICAKEWVNKKFNMLKKQNIRNKFIQNMEWRHVFVHGKVKDERELLYIKNEKIELLPFKIVVEELCNNDTELGFTGAAAGDLIDIINFI